MKLKDVQNELHELKRLPCFARAAVAGIRPSL
jgi:hypothetical protein